MSGLLNRDQEVLDALDIRLEPKYNSDIVPIALTAKGAINQRSSKVADENIIYQLIEHNKKNFYRDSQPHYGWTYGSGTLEVQTSITLSIL